MNVNNDLAESPAPGLTVVKSTPSVSPMAPLLSMTNMSSDDMHSTVGKVKGTTKSQAGMNGGRWTEQEHQSFLAGLRLYGREWKKVASKIKTRTSAQIRSHAQKYFAKLARDDETRKQGGLLQHFQLTGSETDSLRMGMGGGSSPSGYMSDDGNSSTLSGDEGADTDSNTSQRSAAVAPLLTNHHSYPSMASMPSPAPGPSLFKSSVTRSTPTPPLTLNLIGNTTKKRSRTMTTNDLHSSPGSQRAKLENTLPSHEEMLEKVSPRVRQRLACLIEAEISALQVLSCYALLQQQDVHPSGQHRHHDAPQAPMGLLMLTTERTSSIY